MLECSFDKGFYIPQNWRDLEEKLELSILPKKGRLSQEDLKFEHSEEFIKARYQHSAVESAINALEVHGLDRCLDHGIEGFKRYVSLAVLGRNIQKLGIAIKEKEIRSLKYQGKLKKVG